MAAMGGVEISPRQGEVMVLSFALSDLSENWKAWKKASSYQSESWEDLGRQIEALRERSQAAILGKAESPVATSELENLWQKMGLLEFGKAVDARITGLRQASAHVRFLEKYEAVARGILFGMANHVLPSAEKVGALGPAEIDLKVRDYEKAFALYQSGKLSEALQLWENFESDGWLRRLENRKFYGDLEMLIPELGITIFSGMTASAAKNFTMRLTQSLGLSATPTLYSAFWYVSFTGVSRALPEAEMADYELPE